MYYLMDIGKEEVYEMHADKYKGSKKSNNSLSGNFSFPIKYNISNP